MVLKQFMIIIFLNSGIKFLCHPNFKFHLGNISEKTIQIGQIFPHIKQLKNKIMNRVFHFLNGGVKFCFLLPGKPIGYI